MKILLDSCISAILRPPLEADGHEVDWVGDWSADPGDAEILAFAYQQGAVVVTLDKDFGTLAVLHRQPHAGIVRLVNLSLRDQARVCLMVLKNYSPDLEAGALITVEQDRVRIRLMD
jgi:predicted nuclease of predicted toxin-antitoxin system